MANQGQSQFNSDQSQTPIIQVIDQTPDFLKKQLPFLEQPSYKIAAFPQIPRDFCRYVAVWLVWPGMTFLVLEAFKPIWEPYKLYVSVLLAIPLFGLAVLTWYLVKFKKLKQSRLAEIGLHWGIAIASSASALMSLFL
ncbi:MULTISPECIES: hypothetical protein [Trichocoleus]|uniref:Uncharacterized protein n=1 Tax=Trichocoleus desertorum GB2-A4 TaxID=2933944 RepID=A0ABV0JCW2_9CYAN|nr:hypothetical protein [Trichocoleus sp. FACHB-46]MBD1864268.1 hypothetical protein [Trichocoleus sp. FACHB-46]